MPANARESVDAQRAAYGGIKWGAAFFGWLSANGLAVIIAALLAAGGLALGLTKGTPSSTDVADSAKAIGIGGALAILVVTAIAYFAGGYLAGRMARFDGVRQGVAVWLIGLVIVIALAIIGGAFGAKYNVLSALNLPRIPVGEGTGTAGAVISLIAVLVVTLLAAAWGGLMGERYHRRVDRTGYDAVGGVS